MFRRFVIFQNDDKMGILPCFYSFVGALLGNSWE